MAQVIPSTSCMVAGLVGAVANLNRSRKAPSVPGTPLADFICVSEPPISASIYLKQAGCRFVKSDSTWTVALILVDRFCRRAGVALGPLNVHRLTLTALLVAAKLTIDGSGITRVFSRSLRMPAAELNTMEISFLQVLDWDINVDPKRFARVQEALPSLLTAAHQREGEEARLLPDSLSC
eukprot:Hpha_TRINITY_DN15015_c1_g1::TRINITY_DN15015_c1_g1_i1::g.123507::m.123507